MSRSNNTELINPAQRFFEWSGSEGVVRYFDKTLGEKGENVNVDLPFKFLILDRVSQVTGGIDTDNGYVGFWSNAIRNTKTQKLIVRSKRGIEVQGFYDHIKGHPGVKFMTGLYIGFYDESEVMQIGYLKLRGAALTAWIEFTRAHRNIYEGAFGIEDKLKKKKGTNSYFEPVFKYYAKVSEQADKTATQLDVHLQAYLSAYFAAAGLAEAEAEYTVNGQARAAAAGAEYDPPEMAPMTVGEPPEDFNDDDWNNQF